MDPVLLARIQFGLTIAFHFLFPPVSIGLAWIIAFMSWRALRSGEAVYEQMTRFWVKILALIFVVGVASGITMEFQFGTNWSTYSRFVGDIFGSPLAAEGVFTFFLESTFIGILVFGRRRISKKMYFFSALMVALGATFSAFWIIVANSWQQTPVAYQIVGEGAFRRAELTNFWQAVFNPSTMPRYVHTVIASMITGGFFVAGSSAWFLLKERHQDFARRSLMIGLVLAAVASLLVVGAGHWHAVQVAETQPAKLAAFEGLYETQDGVGMVIWGFPDEANQTVRFRIAVPKLLSLLISFNPNSTVTGLDQFPVEEWPPISLSFYPYHLMILLAGWFVLISWLGILIKEHRFSSRAYLKALLVTLPLPILVMELGWMAAELGRQPWVVYGLLKTEDAVSVVVPAGQILATIILFVLVYALLLALLIFLIVKEFRHGPEENLSKEALQ